MHSHHHIAHGQFACPPWLAGMLESPLRKVMHRPEKVLAGLVEAGMTVLDVGCGPGYFSLTMARMVGPQGQVIAADLQPDMLAQVGAHAAKARLLERITLHQCEPMRIGWSEPVDFVLAFWMVHEVPDRKALLDEMYSLLKPGGRLLVVEPDFHADRINFTQTLSLAAAAGFSSPVKRKVTISRAVVLGK